MEENKLPIKVHIEWNYCWDYSLEDFKNYIHQEDLAIDHIDEKGPRNYDIYIVHDFNCSFYSVIDEMKKNFPGDVTIQILPY